MSCLNNFNNKKDLTVSTLRGRSIIIVRGDVLLSLFLTSFASDRGPGFRNFVEVNTKDVPKKKIQFLLII